MTYPSVSSQHQSRNLSKTTVLESVSAKGCWRLETGGAVEWLQRSMRMVWAAGFFCLIPSLIVFPVAPNWALSLLSWGFSACALWWFWNLFRRVRRGANVLIETDQAQVIVGGETWPKESIKEIQALCRMKEDIAGFQVHLHVQNASSPVLIMEGWGLPLPEAELRQFCAGCGLTLALEKLQEEDSGRRQPEETSFDQTGYPALELVDARSLTPLGLIRVMGCAIFAVVGLMFFVTMSMQVLGGAEFGMSAPEKLGFFSTWVCGWLYIIGSMYCFIRPIKARTLLWLGIVLSIIGGSLWVPVLVHGDGVGLGLLTFAEILTGFWAALIVCSFRVEKKQSESSGGEPGAQAKTSTLDG